jgi:tetratricopeptide (TPR) repeat protein
MDGRFRWIRLELVDGWPGLARLWYGGWLHGLLIAVAFSILLNTTLLSTLTWPAWMPTRVRAALWAMSLVVWFGGWVDSRYIRRRWRVMRDRDPQLDLFLSARGEYLKRNWPSAEQMLDRLLRQTPEDVEARLMLATLLRHRGQLAEAKEQLRRLQRWSRAAAWNLEIRHEWERLANLECSAELVGTPSVESAPALRVAGHSEAA